MIFFIRQQPRMKLRDLTTPLLFLLGILEQSTVQVNCQDLVAPYITFRGRILQNHSYVNFFEIGNDTSDGVQCHTDLTTCCNSSYGPHSGQWYSPTGVTVQKSYNYLYPMYQNAFNQGLAIVTQHQRNFYGSVNGIYRCDIDTTDSTHAGRNDTAPSPIYVGIYTSEG